MTPSPCPQYGILTKLVRFGATWTIYSQVTKKNKIMKMMALLAMGFDQKTDNFHYVASLRSDCFN